MKLKRAPYQVPDVNVKFFIIHFKINGILIEYESRTCCAKTAYIDNFFCIQGLPLK